MRGSARRASAVPANTPRLTSPRYTLYTARFAHRVDEHERAAGEKREQPTTRRRSSARSRRSAATRARAAVAEHDPRVERRRVGRAKRLRQPEAHREPQQRAVERDEGEVRAPAEADVKLRSRIGATTARRRAPASSSRACAPPVRRVQVAPYARGTTATAAIPSACANRAATSVPMSCASAHATDASTYTTSAHRTPADARSGPRSVRRRAAPRPAEHVHGDRQLHLIGGGAERARHRRQRRQVDVHRQRRDRHQGAEEQPSCRCRRTSARSHAVAAVARTSVSGRARVPRRV